MLGQDRPKLQDIGDECFPPLRPLSQLPDQVGIGKLLPGHGIIPRNTALVADLELLVGCFQAKKLSRVSLLCALEDGAFLCIQNAVVSWADEKDELRKLLPRARVAITSGIFRDNVIYVPCMAAVVFIGLHEDDESAIASLEFEKRAELIRLRGNERFSCGEYVLAGLFYDAAVEAALEAEQEDELVLGLANHAECMLRLCRYEEAISSCDRALGLAPHHSKSHLRRGKAFSALQNHREALASFTSALTFSEEEQARASTRRAVEEATKLVRQQEIGDFETLRYFLSGFKEQHLPDSFSDFTSDAVEIRMTSDGKGRGLFLTRDVTVGELLLVSNPVTVSGETGFSVETIRACGRSSRARRILNSLPDSHAVRSSPGVRSFAGYSSGEDDNEVIDVRRVKRAVLLGGFRFRVSGGEVKMIFGLPGMINHSCLPNSTMVMVGGALFVRAAKLRRAGEEITVAYVDCLRPREYRSGLLKRRWGFKCRCRRCLLEKTLKRESGFETPKVISVEGGAAEQLRAEAETFSRVEEALEKLSEISEEEKSMIRVGHLAAYCAVALNTQVGICGEVCRKFKAPSGSELMNLLHDLVPGCLNAIVLVARIELRVMAGLLSLPDTPEQGDRVCSFRDAMAALTGDGARPLGEYINICSFLNDDQSLSSLVHTLSKHADLKLDHSMSFLQSSCDLSGKRELGDLALCGSGFDASTKW